MVNCYQYRSTMLLTSVFCATHILQLTFCEVDWVVKSHYLGSAFFDASASAFIMPSLLSRASNNNYSDTGGNVDHTCSVESDVVGGKLVGASLSHATPHIPVNPNVSPTTSATTSATTSPTTLGCGLGPEWLAKSQLRTVLPAQTLQSGGHLNVSGCRESAIQNCKCYLIRLYSCSYLLMQIHYEQEVCAISDDSGISWQDTLLPTSSDTTMNSSGTGTAPIDGIDTENAYPLYIRTTTGEVSTVLLSLLSYIHFW